MCHGRYINKGES